jgi:hypothetical protein
MTTIHTTINRPAVGADGAERQDPSYGPSRSGAVGSSCSGVPIREFSDPTTASPVTKAQTGHGRVEATAAVRTEVGPTKCRSVGSETVPQSRTYDSKSEMVRHGAAQSCGGQGRISQLAAPALLRQATDAAAHSDPTRRDREIHKVLARFSKQERATLAADEQCPTAAMKHLVLDRPVVQRALAGNPTFTGQALRSAVSSFDWGRMFEASDGAGLAGLCFHPYCPAELDQLDLEQYCWFDPIRWLLHPDLPMDDLRGVLACAPDDLALVLLRRESIRSQNLVSITLEMDRRIAESPVRGSIPADERELSLIADNEPKRSHRLRILVAAVGHHRLSLDHLVLRAEDSRRSIRAAVAANPSFPGDKARQLVSRDGGAAALALMTNPGIDSDHVDDMATELIQIPYVASSTGPGSPTSTFGATRREVELELALLGLLNHDLCRPGTTQLLTDYPIASVRTLARAQDPRTSSEELATLSFGASAEFAQVIARHPNVTLENLILLLPHPGIDKAVVSHPNLTPEMLTRLLGDQRQLVRVLASSLISSGPWSMLRVVLAIVDAATRVKLLRGCRRAKQGRAVTDHDSKNRFAAARITTNVRDLNLLANDPNGHVRRATCQRLLAAL